LQKDVTFCPTRPQIADGGNATGRS
jgi:hypothetical protein